MRVINRAGHKSGKLTAVSRADRRPGVFWNCVCDCGTTSVVSSKNWGKTSSCGCDWDVAVKGEMVGRRFGKLTVRQQVESKISASSKFAQYRCVCDCGTEKIALGMSLRNGDTTSCGCAYKVAGLIRVKSDSRKRAVIRRIVHERRAAKLAATKPWSHELFRLVLLEAHHLAVLREVVTGIPYDVDHIIPLKSDVVCGLHNEFNIQVITRSANRSKSNRYWPDMPESTGSAP